MPHIGAPIDSESGSEVSIESDDRDVDELSEEEVEKILDELAR